MESKIYKIDFAGRELSFEIGKYALLANGSVLARYGETAVLVTACASEKPREGIDFFPLTVDYEERLYSVGKIPGGFIKREGKPSEKAILSARLIDRPIRPLFPKDFYNDVSVIATVLSVDPDNPPDILAMIGSSVALSISDIPFLGPTGSVLIGYVNGQIVVNPDAKQREKSKLHLVVSGTKDKVMMIEAGANEVSEEIMYEAILKAQEEITKIVTFIEEICKEIGKPKMQYPTRVIPEEIREKVKELAYDKVYNYVQIADKIERDKKLDELRDEILQTLEQEYPDNLSDVGEALYDLEKKIVRHLIGVEGKRPDGRKIDEIRPLAAEVGILPRTHGSAMFKRGFTQVMTVATLGAVGEMQMLDGLEEEESKRYMHHYNFPPYSTGEAKPIRAPGRREIGHGALAERALEPVIPSEDQFPYTIRLVSEVLTSNGSTSQASVCGSTLALMDAGVPIKAPVAGISVGLITKEDGSFITMTDIQGIEDFFGDMDFKVAGTREGITAIQLDIKIHGLTKEIIWQALNQAKEARYKILDFMETIIAKPRERLSEYAPKIFKTEIDPDKIRDVIGPGGKMINKIIAETNVKIDIEPDGKVFVASQDSEACKRAISMIEGIAKDIEVGQMYLGKVTKIMPYGAFVEIFPGKEGLLHISQLDDKKVQSVEDILKVDEVVLVKVIGVDKLGRVSLSRKDALNSNDDEQKERKA
ncbi:polyribonucleotide nucleotidyltransferase [Caldicellulosiruptoraceae bacterium PP1]